MDTNGDISLTDKSRSDKRFLMRPNGLLDIVPLAKKEMGDVTAAADEAAVTEDPPVVPELVELAEVAAHRPGLRSERRRRAERPDHLQRQCLRRRRPRRQCPGRRGDRYGQGRAAAGTVGELRSTISAMLAPKPTAGPLSTSLRSVPGWTSRPSMLRTISPAAIRLALQRAETMALWITPPMLWTKNVLYPFVIALNGLGNLVLLPRVGAIGASIASSRSRTSPTYSSRPASQPRSTR